MGNSELLGQLPLFWAAPILGAIAAGYFYNTIFEAPLALERTEKIKSNL